MQTCSGSSDLTYFKKNQSKSSIDFFYFSSKVSWKWPKSNWLDFLLLLYERVYKIAGLTILNIFRRSILILKIKFLGKNLTWLFDFRNKSTIMIKIHSKEKHYVEIQNAKTFFTKAISMLLCKFSLEFFFIHAEK